MKHFSLESWNWNLLSLRSSVYFFQFELFLSGQLPQGWERQFRLEYRAGRRSIDILHSGKHWTLQTLRDNSSKQKRLRCSRCTGNGSRLLRRRWWEENPLAPTTGCSRGLYGAVVNIPFLLILFVILVPLVTPNNVKVKTFDEAPRHVLVSWEAVDPTLVRGRFLGYKIFYGMSSDNEGGWFLKQLHTSQCSSFLEWDNCWCNVIVTS